MRSNPIFSVIFHLAVAVCLWPLYQAATVVVGWAQDTFRLDRAFAFPSGHVWVAALQGGLIMWAIGAGLVQFRKGQAWIAWLIVLLALLPTLTGLAAPKG